MEKPNMVYPYDEILFSYKKERCADTCCSVYEPQKLYTESNRSQAQNISYLGPPCLKYSE